MSYRILKISKSDEKHFRVQKKFLFWWTTCTYFDCCIDGSMAGNYPYEFKTKEDALKFIDNQKEIIEICK